MTQSNYALRLQSWLKKEADRLAKEEGTTLNQFINVAVAEKVAALRTADYFRERARRADVPGALALLDSLGGDEPPRKGDEPYRRPSCRLAVAPRLPSVAAAR